MRIFLDFFFFWGNIELTRRILDWIATTGKRNDDNHFIKSNQWWCCWFIYVLCIIIEYILYKWLNAFSVFVSFLCVHWALSHQLIKFCTIKYSMLFSHYWMSAIIFFNMIDSKEKSANFVCNVYATLNSTINITNGNVYNFVW